MTEKKILKSQLFRHGSKFVVTDESSDTTYGPGTTGFVSFVKGFDQDFPTVAYLVASIIRRGKGGKSRVERAELSTPIFDIDNDVLKENMPDEKRRFYVHIKSLPNTCKIADMEPVDFVGWSFAAAMFICKLGSCAKHFKPWPTSPQSVLNQVLNANDMWQENEEHAIATLTSPEFREDFTRKIRIMESTLVKPALGYMSKVVSLEEAAITHILKINPKDAKTQIAANKMLATMITNLKKERNDLTIASRKLSPSKQAK